MAKSPTEKDAENPEFSYTSEFIPESGQEQAVVDRLKELGFTDIRWSEYSPSGYVGAVELTFDISNTPDHPAKAWVPAEKFEIRGDRKYWSQVPEGKDSNPVNLFDLPEPIEEVLSSYLHLVRNRADHA